MINRRDLFRLTGATGASLLLTQAFGGCAGDPELPPLPEDPQGRWWLNGNYAPVMDEIEELDLVVEGAIPPELDGLFLRNGPNPLSGDTPHWFLGDGMLHGVRISGGQALWYRNRWIETLALQSEEDNIGGNLANTALKVHAGKLLALYEAGVPHEISPDDLSTVGEYAFDGQLSRPMSAHPKIDSATGEMFFTSYSPFAPYVGYHVVDASGALVRNLEIDIDHSPMMHDFQITKSYALLFDFPVHFDSALLQSGFPFRWYDDVPSRIGVLPRDGSSTEVNWIEVDTCFVVHSFNAYEDSAGKIVLDVCRRPHLWRGGPTDFSGSAVPWRWEIDPVAGTVSDTQLDDVKIDFPQIDQRRAVQEHQMLYSLRFAQNDAGLTAPDAIVKIDGAAGTRDIWAPGRYQQPDEAVFIPVGDAQDAGYLMSMVFDRTTATSHVAILDATNVSAGPVARIHMPRRVPFGFHGAWLDQS